MITLAAASCLALNVYFEARDQDTDGQRLVAEVTMQRVLTPGYPADVCSVVWQHGAFSWTEDGKSDKPTDTEAWLLAQIIANETLLYGCDLCTGATHYATVDATPYWADDFQIIGRWGNHIFYEERHALRHPPKRPEGM
ncbi:spore_SleB, spore cortex-lytic enzyme [uncultured Caudovirales phage]|uniref:Spore_SleB, spore cortex-lytic enzyme n=1 Tax=uncultured Caudovirales phage TaxID=2100421 RepID=A0A6J7WUF6_9CAUD|nr:spore_SleB, spore cortex-lytic enzyme [uncultured Caudovirales phage]